MLAHQMTKSLSNCFDCFWASIAQSACGGFDSRVQVWSVVPHVLEEQALRM